MTPAVSHRASASTASATATSSSAATYGLLRTLVPSALGFTSGAARHENRATSEDDHKRRACPLPDVADRPLDHELEDRQPDARAIATAPAWQRCRACERRIPTDAERCPWCSAPIHFELTEASDSAGISDLMELAGKSDTCRFRDVVPRLLDSANGTDDPRKRR